jgi:acyl-CoA reductase-like NAD-dependent aldehyde dehydrogenase
MFMKRFTRNSWRGLWRKTSKLKIGDPREKGVFLGPVVNRRAVENYKAYVSEALKAGGQLLYGGEALEGACTAKASTFSPQS